MIKVQYAEYGIGIRLGALGLDGAPYTPSAVLLENIV